MKSEIARQILVETPIDVRKELSEHWKLFILQSNPMKLNIEQLKEILSITKQTQQDYNLMRFGQCILDALSRKHRTIADMYWKTIYDPYFIDAIVISLFELILDDTAAAYWYSTEEFRDIVGTEIYKIKGGWVIHACDVPHVESEEAGPEYKMFYEIKKDKISSIKDLADFYGIEYTNGPGEHTMNGEPLKVKDLLYGIL